jgi:hypothetical protein
MQDTPPFERVKGVKEPLSLQGVEAQANQFGPANSSNISQIEGFAIPDQHHASEP